jgi:hypothetical protein
VWDYDLGKMWEYDSGSEKENESVDETGSELVATKARAMDHPSDGELVCGSACESGTGLATLWDAQWETMMAAVLESVLDSETGHQWGSGMEQVWAHVKAAGLGSVSAPRWDPWSGSRLGNPWGRR